MPGVPQFVPACAISAKKTAKKTMNAAIPMVYGSKPFVTMVGSLWSSFRLARSRRTGCAHRTLRSDRRVGLVEQFDGDHVRASKSMRAAPPSAAPTSAMTTSENGSMNPTPIDAADGNSEPRRVRPALAWTDPAPRRAGNRPHSEPCGRREISRAEEGDGADREPVAGPALDVV